MTDKLTILRLVLAYQENRSFFILICQPSTRNVREVSEVIWKTHPIRACTKQLTLERQKSKKYLLRILKIIKEILHRPLVSLLLKGFEVCWSDKHHMEKLLLFFIKTRKTHKWLETLKWCKVENWKKNIIFLYDALVLMACCPKIN